MTPAHVQHGNSTGSAPPARYAREHDAVVTRLVLAARDEVPTSLDLLVRSLHGDVWRFVARLSADPQAADDLTQEVFLRALVSLHRFEGRSSARAWLLAIARRTVADSFRRAAARPRVADRDDWQVAAEQARQQGGPGFEEGVVLAELLASIPSERRQAFVLTQLVGLSYAEAAATADCPVGTVRSRVARARASLVALLTEPHAPDPPGARPARRVIDRAE